MAELRAFPLPIGNTCAGCGRTILKAYATDMDAAKAGRGLCGECARATEVVEATVNDEIDATLQAHRLAEEYGIDLFDVAAGLPDGRRIGKGDVQAYLDDLSEAFE